MRHAIALASPPRRPRPAERASPSASLLRREVERGARSQGLPADRVRDEAERALALARAERVALVDGRSWSSGLVLDLAGFVEAPGTYAHDRLSGAARALALAGTRLDLGNLAGALLALGLPYGARESLAMAEGIAFAAGRFAPHAEAAALSPGLSRLGALAETTEPAAALLVTGPDGVLAPSPALRRLLDGDADAAALLPRILGTRRLGSAADLLVEAGLNEAALDGIEAALPRAISLAHALGLAGCEPGLVARLGLLAFEPTILGLGSVPGHPLLGLGASEQARRATAQAFANGLAAGRAAAEARPRRLLGQPDRPMAPGRA